MIDDALEGALLERGLSTQAAHRTASGLERVSGVLRDLAGRRAPTPPARYFVPDRIEVLGKHTEHLSRAGAMVAGYLQTERVAEPGQMWWLKADLAL